MMQYLGIIEQRIGEIVQMYNVSQSLSAGVALDDDKDFGGGDGPGGKGAHQPLKPTVQVPVPPTTAELDYSSSEDEDDGTGAARKPKTIAELRQKTSAMFSGQGRGGAGAMNALMGGAAAAGGGKPSKGGGEKDVDGAALPRSSSMLPTQGGW